jgi:hypothetical protein
MKPRGLLLLAAAALLAACSPLNGPLGGTAADGPVIQHLPCTGTFNYTLDPGQTPRNVYFVFTNPSVTSNITGDPVISPSVIGIDGVDLPAPRPLLLPSADPAPVSRTQRITEFNRDSRAIVAARGGSGGASRAVAPPPDTAGDTATFYTDMDQHTLGGLAPVAASCRLVQHATLADGTTRTVSIWVENSVWNNTDPVNPTLRSGSTDVYSINLAMAQALADRLLNASSTNDIYRWDTSVAGEPWGTHSDPTLIQWDSDRTITILLADLNASYTGTVAVGFFWDKDNYLSSSVGASNERIMFYMDSTLYGGIVHPAETSWLVTNYWPKTIFSTLAHEFQHMIHFYQKQVTYNLAVGTDTWINEMCSMIMEDLVADKLGVPGPRGVDSTAYPAGDAGATGNTGGRIGGTDGYNNYSWYPLTVADPLSFNLQNYSTAYAFGAWLARNYGGTEALRRIVQCAQTDSSAVVGAVAGISGHANETFARLLEEWGTSVLLSQSTVAPVGYRFNTGGWITSSAGAFTYNLGSIDFFNYSPLPHLLTSSGQAATSPYIYSSNVYYQAYSALSAPRTWQITLPQGLAMSVIVQ